MFDHRNNHKPVWKMGSLLSTCNTQVRTTLQLLKFPAAWFVSVSSWCLEISSSAFLIFSCWKAAWAVAPKPQLWEPFIWNCPHLIQLCSIMENRALEEGFVCCSYFLNPLLALWWIGSVPLCCSGCFPAEAEWNRPDCCLFHCSWPRGCMQPSISLHLVLDCSYWKVSQWRRARDFLKSRAAEALTWAKGVPLGRFQQHLCSNCSF